MTFHDQGEFRYYTFPLLEAARLPHAILTRRGGVSRDPYHWLNVGSSVGDDPACVRENRRRALALFDRNPESVPELFQVHSTRMLLGRLRGAGEPLPQADGIVTDSASLTLMMRFADCVPILLYDPVRHAAGIAHAGWKGTLDGVAARAVEAFHEHFGSPPEDLLAGIGPSIGPDHYAIGEERAAAFRSSFGAVAEPWLERRDDGIHLNLWAANEFILRRSGVKKIETSGICTGCHTEDWYSHRAEHGRTGRFGAIVWLKEN
jgi:YfiH family protein